MTSLFLVEEEKHRDLEKLLQEHQELTAGISQTRNLLTIITYQRQPLFCDRNKINLLRTVMQNRQKLINKILACLELQRFV